MKQIPKVCVSHPVSVTDEEEELEEQDEQQPQISHASSKKFKVSCGALEGTLHQKRFASGNSVSVHAQ